MKTAISFSLIQYPVVSIVQSGLSTSIEFLFLFLFSETAGRRSLHNKGFKPIRVEARFCRRSYSVKKSKARITTKRKISGCEEGLSSYFSFRFLISNKPNWQAKFVRDHPDATIEPRVKLPSKHNLNLLFLSVSTRGVIGQFYGPYFTVQPAKFESFLSRAPD